MEYEIIKKERLFSEFFKIDRVDIQHDNFRDDKKSLVRRYHLQRPEAVAIILENTTTGNLILVEQFRYSSIDRSAGNGWALEIIAGLIDKGESPLNCAIRETYEETGYRVEKLELITTFFASIGISNELVHLFHGEVTSADKIGEGGGLAHENEDLAIREMSRQKLMESIKTGEINDSKTIIGIQWLLLNKTS
ncbi:MAG: NUDIX hydrolase [Proteobacteria bacterium]|nr:NUDIX hydrolase [Pseudomonadota bacterium]